MCENSILPEGGQLTPHQLCRLVLCIPLHSRSGTTVPMSGITCLALVVNA